MTGLLTELYVRCDFSDPLCPWKTCLGNILELARASLDPARCAPRKTWTDLDTIADVLVDRYADVLDNRVDDAGIVCSLTWDVLKLDPRFTAMTELIQTPTID